MIINYLTEKKRLAVAQALIWGIPLISALFLFLFVQCCAPSWQSDNVIEEAFAELVFKQPNYKNRSVREVEEKAKEKAQLEAK